jgi:hypothetical protein
MAWYDPVRNEIQGAAPESLIYWHERGHQVTRPLALFTIEIIPHILLLAIGSLAYGLPVFARYCFWSWVGLQFLNEVLAWAYAFWNHPRGLRHFLNAKRSSHLLP